MSAQTKRNMLDQDLNSMCIIGGREQLKELKKHYLQQTESALDHESAVGFISDIHIKNKYETVMEIIEETIQTFSRKIPPEEKAMLLKMIRSRSKLKALIT